MVDEQIQQPMQQPLVPQPIQQPLASQPSISVQVETPQKSSVWIWWLVGISVLIILGIGAWFLFSGGSSIPQPPALPE